MLNRILIKFEQLAMEIFRRSLKLDESNPLPFSCFNYEMHVIKTVWFRTSIFLCVTRILVSYMFYGWILSSKVY